MGPFVCPIVGRALSPYERALAALPTPTLLARTDLSSAPNNGSLSSYPLINEGSVGSQFTGSLLWLTNSQNGHRGLRVNSNSQSAQGGTGLTINAVLGGAMSYTAFAVEKRTDTQGSNSGTNVRNNNGSMGDSDAWKPAFSYNSRSFNLYLRQGGSHAYETTSDSFTDNTAYVIAWRMDNSNLRFSFNGAITSRSHSRSYPSSSNRFDLLINSGGSQINIGYEYIVVPDAVSNTLMDDMVTALKDKWGIT